MSKISTRPWGRARLLGSAALAALVFSLGSLASPTLAQPALEVLGTWGGTVSTVFIDEAVDPYIAYVGSGRRLVILDVEDPQKIIELGSLDLGNTVLDVKVRDGYAYVCVFSQPNHFCVVDVSVLTAPNLVWSFQDIVYTRASEVDLYGNTAYVRAGGSAVDLETFDISDPENPVYTGTVTWSIVGDSVIVDNLLYTITTGSLAGGGQRLHIYDLAAPLGPYIDHSLLQPVGNVILPGTEGDAAAITVQDGYAYAATRTGEGVLAVVDVSDPNLPVVEGSYDSCGAGDVAVSGGIACLVDCAELVFLDVATDPAVPSVVDTYSTHGSIRGVEVVGTRAYVMDGGEGLIILDISGVGVRGEPVRLGNWHSPAEFRQMDKVGNLLYLTDESNGITILNVADPQRPTLVGAYQTSEALGQWRDNWGIDVRDEKAYLSAGHGGIEVVDVSDPANPIFLGNYPDWPWGGHAIAMKVNAPGDVAHVGFENCGGAWIINFDISDPQNITAIGSVNLGGVCNKPYTIDMDPNAIAHVAVDGFIAVANLGDPTQPSLIGTQPWINGGNPYNLVLDGSIRYVAHPRSSEGGVYTQDVSDPANPVDLGHWQHSASGNKGIETVALRGGRLYVAAVQRARVYELDVTEPNAPVLVTETIVPHPRSILVDGRYAYIAAYRPSDATGYGLTIVEVAEAILGDLNDDGCVDLSDLATLLANYDTPSGMTYADGDLDGDEDVDLSDLAELLAHYGQGCA